MISDIKTQNIILVATLLVGLVSAVGLASSASWYSGSYTIVRYLDIDLVDVRVANLDLENTTVNPALLFDFKVVAPSAAAGEAELSYFTMVVHLNGEKIAYAPFRKSVPLDLRTIYPEYNQTYTIGSTIIEDLDKQILYDAATNDEWTFSLTLYVFYDVFQSVGDQVRVIAYSYQGAPSGWEGI
ncbi:MAG: hypothetical protein ACFFD3_03075 [Candidatus Thorarchaeota archaeon]